MQTAVSHLPQMAFLRVLLILSLVSAYTGLKKINVKPAKTVRLDCQGPKKSNITLLEWKRHDLLSDGYVFFYRDGRLHKTFQHPIFKDRVELSDLQMKNGNMSIILYNTTVNDTGTYECRMIMGNTWHRGRATSEIKHRIRLKVRTKGQTGGDTEDGGKEDGGKEDGIRKYLGLEAGMSVFSIAMTVITIIMIEKNKKQEGGQTGDTQHESDVALYQK